MPPSQRSPCAYPSRRRPDTRERQCPDRSYCFHRTDQGRQRDRVQGAVKMQTATTVQAQSNRNRWWCLSDRGLRYRNSGRHWNVQREEKRPGVGRPQTLRLEVMPPRINLLSRNLMTLRHLGHTRPSDPNRHDNLELVVIMPEAPPLHPKNFAPHHRPRLRYVAKDVIKHVS